MNQKVKDNKIKKKRTAIDGRNQFIYHTINFNANLFIKNFLHIKIKNNVEEIKKPCIVLCNHCSFFDFFYTNIAFGKYNPRYITARLYFYKKFNSYMLRSVGCYPKSMFTADIENALQSLKLMKNGEMLVMMPEARLSTCGKYEGIQDNTIKFIKKMDVDVYTLNLYGSYFARPKWGDKIRWGSHIEGEINKLFIAGDAKLLDYEEYKKKIETRLYYNEFDWLDKHPELHYKSKTLAKGLENILFLCPNCHKFHTIRTDGNRIYCDNCGYSVNLNDRYAFDDGFFKNFQEWYDYQKDILRTEVNKEGFVLRDSVKLSHACKNGRRILELAGKGVCTLNKDGFRYIGSEYGKNIDKFVKLENIYRLLFGAGEDFEFYEGNEIYYFQPEDRRTCVMWYVVSELLKENYN